MHYHKTTEDRVISKFENGVLSITFNRPQTRNAFPQGMSGEIASLMRTAQKDDAVRCLVFSGAGDHFTAGGDVTMFQEKIKLNYDERRQFFNQQLKDTTERVKAFLAFDRPIISKIRGSVAGAGLMFPLASDMVLVDSTASFVFAHKRIGLSPDGGVSYLLPRVVGLRPAKRLVLTAATVKAKEALALGIADQIIDSKDLDKATAALANHFSQSPQQATIMTKHMMAASLDNGLQKQLDLERSNLVTSVTTADFDEGVTAFFEKRTPKFPSAQ